VKSKYHGTGEQCADAVRTRGSEYQGQPEVVLSCFEVTRKGFSGLEEQSHGGLKQLLSSRVYLAPPLVF
jgi:hypothetical protein